MAAIENRFLAELGLISLYRSPSDVKILILQRFVRFFAFGGSTIVLVLYLNALSIPDASIGMFMSLSLVGDLVSFALVLFADGLGRKLVLALGALLMAMSGVVLAMSGNYWMLLAAAIFGVVSPKYG
jgi:predicted MFS family arabinose efflux permease